MEQQRLYRLAIEAVTWNAHRDHWGRWAVSLRARRQDEGWGDGEWRVYDGLTSAELADVQGAELERLLGL
jgi:hypothetical protein